MGIWRQSECRDKRQPGGLGGFRRRLENTNLSAQGFGIRFIDCESFYRKFHFTKVNHLVATVNHQVNLRLFGAVAARPGGGLYLNTANTKRIFYLAQMTEAYLFKCVATPGAHLRRVEAFDPEILIYLVLVPDESQVKKEIKKL